MSRLQTFYTHRLSFRRWSSPSCCPGWTTVMLRWLAYQPTYLIVSSLYSTQLLGRLLDCDDQTTSLTLLPVFTGCEHLMSASRSSLNWQSLSTELFTALHLGICLICYIALLTSHQDAVSGRQPPLNWSSLCGGL